MKEIRASYCVQSAKGEALKSECFEGEMTIERLGYIIEQIKGAECFGLVMTCIEEGRGFRSVQINKSSVSDSAVFYLNTYSGLHEGEFGNDIFYCPAEDISMPVLNALYVAMRDDKKAVVQFSKKGDDRL